VSASHFLAARNSVSIDELANEEFVMLPSKPVTNFSSVIASIFDDAGFSPKIAQQTKLFTTIVGLVGAGLGISIVPSSVRTMDISGVKFLVLDGVIKQAGLDFVWRRRPGSPLLEKFAQEVERQFEATRCDKRQIPTGPVKAGLR
jgi:DNA-binding transcriptional LysR family regulator